ncbi:putative sodium/myo-inositol cotransporter [Apostichopus japonicus]|uniref:Putative sodium/myo-inositol cotransporter n=1 Tax=Stichopus japonicus TaxID=307972 RepID=A0A2G8JS00_STIJA|nr:putative sodium/myo-inositol cotransporter [Apostichopus japonicus]
MDAISDDTRNNLTEGCGYPREDSWQMLREPLHSDMPWAGFLFGQTVASIWYWCTDQLMVQRALAAKNLSHAQGGCLLAGYIKLLPMFLMVLPGMISRVFFPNELACASAESCLEVCGSATGCSNLAYPKLVASVYANSLYLLFNFTGMKGIMLAVMLAALMSDLTSIFNSTSTLFTMDIWKYFREKISDKEPSVKELMVVGRLVVVVMVIISILWIPVIQQMQGGQLFLYIQEISAYLAPPIAATYLVAIFWSRGNEQGCFWGLVAGFIVGVIRMVLDFVWRGPPCWGEDHRPAITAKVHYMYFALILFWITVIVDVVVSLLTKPPEQEKLIRTTWWSRFSSAKRTDEDEFKAEGIDPPDKQETSNEESHKESYCHRGYNWFCGYDDTARGKFKMLEQREHLRKITSLKQSAKAKVFLNLNLVIILIVSTILYIYFSIPNTRVTSVFQ